MDHWWLRLIRDLVPRRSRPLLRLVLSLVVLAGLSTDRGREALSDAITASAARAQVRAESLLNEVLEDLVTPPVDIPSGSTTTTVG